MTETPASPSVPDDDPAVAPVDEGAPAAQGADVVPAEEGADGEPTDGGAEAAPAEEEPSASDAETPADASVPAEAPAVEDIAEEASAEGVVEEVVVEDVVEAGTPTGPADATADADTTTEADAAADTTTETGPAAGAAPRPTPATIPTPAQVRPGPRPALPRPAPVASPVAAAMSLPAHPTGVDPAEEARAASFGRVDEDGTVLVREAAGERVVGQFPGATEQEALQLYVRRYLDLEAKLVLFETRLATADMTVREIDQTLSRLTEELQEPAAVGDLDGLRARLDQVRGVAAERRAAAEAERAAAREAALAARTEIVEEAERIAATDPSRMQWRPAGEQLRTLLERWKQAQHEGPRLDRPTEEALWKRFSHARTTFDRERRHFFAELESRNASAKAAKEEIVAEAERLQSSTDWGPTAGAFRDLMARWKAAGRASRRDDDALWARFRAAQDAFFAARDAYTAATDTEFRANLEVKEALLAEAEALLPVRDLNAAKRALRSIQDRWEAAGKVPRGDLQRVEGRLRAVESAVRDAEQAQWRRTNPETRARAEGAAAQLEQAIAALEADLAKAQAAGDARRIADAQAALDARRAWLEQVQRAAQDARG